MYVSTIQYCPITLSTSEIKSDYDTYTHPSLDIFADYVYSPCYGSIVQKCNYIDDKHLSVVIQFNGIISLRLTNLIECDLNNGDLVRRCQYIGKCDKWVGFELLLYDPPQPPITPFRVTINKYLSLYKYDPNLILNGTLVLNDPKDS